MEFGAGGIERDGLAIGGQRFLDACDGAQRIALVAVEDAMAGARRMAESKHSIASSWRDMAM